MSDGTGEEDLCGEDTGRETSCKVWLCAYQSCTGLGITKGVFTATDSEGGRDLTSELVDCGGGGVFTAAGGGGGMDLDPAADSEGGRDLTSELVGCGGGGAFTSAGGGEGMDLDPAADSET